MTLTYPWTFALERERAQFVVNLRRKRRRIDPLLISLGVAVWTLLESGQKGLATVAVIVLIVRAALVYLPPFWLDFLAPAKEKTDWPTQTLTLLDSGLELQRPHRPQASAAWSALSELVETESIFFLCDHEAGAIAVPKTAFESDESRSEFKVKVEAGLAAAKAEKAETSSTLPLGR